MFFRNAFAILLFLSSLIPLRAQEVPFIPVFQGEELARHYLQIATLRAAWAVEKCIINTRDCNPHSEEMDIARYADFYKVIHILSKDRANFLIEENIQFPKFVFLSGREHPEYFSLDDGHKESSTGSSPGSPIYINMDYFYEEQSPGIIRPRSISHWARLILHELIHQTSELKLEFRDPGSFYSSEKRSLRAKKDHVFVDSIANDAIGFFATEFRLDLSDQWLPLDFSWQSERIDLMLEQVQRGYVYSEHSSKLLLMQKQNLYDLTDFLKNKLSEKNVCSHTPVGRNSWELNNLHWRENQNTIEIAGLLDVSCIKNRMLILYDTQNFYIQFEFKKQILAKNQGLNATDVVLKIDPL